MLSPSQNSSKKAFSRVALVGKYQADGIEGHLNALAKLVSDMGCEVFIETATATHLGLENYPTKSVEEFAGSIDLALVLGGDGTMLGIGRQLAGKKVLTFWLKANVCCGMLAAIEELIIQKMKRPFA